MKEIKIFKGSYYYNKFIESFYTNDSMIFLEPTNNNVSKAIFYHLTQFRLAEWKMRVNFKRMRKHQSSDFFQDLICFYLKRLLTNDHEFIIEEGKRNNMNENIQVDIAIKKGTEYIFVIEVKTTTGWDRINKFNEDIYCDRIKEISDLWKINEDNVIYILETFKNRSVDESIFWNKQENKPMGRDDFKKLYSHIYPLFYEPGDPFYWKEFK